jgi:release factor glutamine methyltransferase
MKRARVDPSPPTVGAGHAAPPRATVGRALEAAVARLAAAGVETPRIDAEWLLADTLGVRRLELHALLEQPLTAAESARFEAVIRRRAAREPLQHVLGWEGFRGLRLGVSPAALVPRPETEVLVEWALELLPAPAAGVRRLAVDLGTGSGCIACALAVERPDLDVIATDLSPEAARVAAANAAALGLARRVRVVVSDLFAALAPAGADLVVANPPYLPSALLSSLAPEVHAGDPRLALDGGPDGLAVTRRLVMQARHWLPAGAILVLETAGGDAARTIQDLLRGSGFADVRSRADLAGTARFVAGRKA